MTREPTIDEVSAAYHLCIVRHGAAMIAELTADADAGVWPPCDSCRADILRLVDASPSETTGGEVVAWHLHPSVTETARQLHRHLATANRSAQWLNEAYELCQRLGDAVAAIYSAHPAPTATGTSICPICGVSSPHVHSEEQLSDYRRNQHPRNLFAAPPAGDGVPRVTEDEHGVPTMDVEGWTTHDSKVRLFYHGKTLDMLEVVLPESTYREPKGGPERRATVRLGDLRNALEALALSYCATRQGEA